MGITDALNATKSIITVMDNPPPAVFVRPDEYSRFDFSRLPVVMVSEAVNTENTVTRQTLGGGVVVDWTLEILVFVSSGQIESDKDAAAIEPMTRDIVERIIAELSKKDNITLGGTVNSIMPDGTYTYRVGHLAIDTDIFWGAVLSIPVRQNFSV